MIRMALVVAALAGSAAAAQDFSVAHPVAELRGLDKFSGLSSAIEAVVGAPVAFERLTITVRACLTGPGAAPADAAVWLEIVDLQAPAAPVFAGWMLASSPAMSALDHPRYDVWAVSCRTSSGEAS